MDILTPEEFATLARTGEVILPVDRDEAVIANYLFKERGWTMDIHFEKETLDKFSPEGFVPYLKVWVVHPD